MKDSWGVDLIAEVNDKLNLNLQYVPQEMSPIRVKSRTKRYNRKETRTSPLRPSLKHKMSSNSLRVPHFVKRIWGAPACIAKEVLSSPTKLPKATARSEIRKRALVEGAVANSLLTRDTVIANVHKMYKKSQMSPPKNGSPPVQSLWEPPNQKLHISRVFLPQSASTSTLEMDIYSDLSISALDFIKCMDFVPSLASSTSSASSDYSEITTPKGESKTSGADDMKYTHKDGKHGYQVTLATNQKYSMGTSGSAKSNFEPQWNNWGIKAF